VPKRGGGVRWITRLDPADDAAYRAAVTPHVGRIERSLGPEVLSSRAVIAGSRWGSAPWRPARARWRSVLRAAVTAAPPGTVFVVTDVRDCYGSIAPEAIDSLLGPAATEAVALLGRFRDAGVRGLPIGPAASAVLANAALRELDASLRAAGVPHVRWVDDVVVWGARSDVRRALRSLRVAAGAIGLEVHEGKTIVLDAPEDARAVFGSRTPSMPRCERTTGIIAAP
jgi:hypothetical protein